MRNGKPEKYPYGTREFIAVTVTLNGVPVTAGVEFSVVRVGDTPTVFVAPTTLDGQIGVMTDNQPRGTYQVFGRVAGVVERPLVLCGEYTVT